MAPSIRRGEITASVSCPPLLFFPQKRVQGENAADGPPVEVHVYVKETSARRSIGFKVSLEQRVKEFLQTSRLPLQQL